MGHSILQNVLLLGRAGTARNAGALQARAEQLLDGPSKRLRRQAAARTVGCMHIVPRFAARCCSIRRYC